MKINKYRRFELLRSMVLLVLVSILASCSGNRTSTSAVTNNMFHSAGSYFTVDLPEDWAAVEGPENIVLTGHIEGEVAFNSWGQPDYWSHEVCDTLSDGHVSCSYSPQTVLSQIPDGGAYIVLTHAQVGQVDLSQLPPEYVDDDLTSLLKTHDWRYPQSVDNSISFVKWGKPLELTVYCQPDASNATLVQINELLESWKFQANLK